MSKFGSGGFTIIEVSLFLAVTGILIAGIFIGTGSSLATQRYRDSVTSLQSFFQQQYREVENVDVQSGLSDTACPATYRGQSNCVVLGRYLTHDGSVNNNRISVKSVIGVAPSSGAPESLNDVQVFLTNGNGSQLGYNTRISNATLTISSYDLEWGAQIVKPVTGLNFSFSLLILRSPASGVIRTFVNDTAVVADNNIQTGLISASSSLSLPVKMCIKPNGSAISGKNRAVVINANSSTASGVELFTENDTEADIQC